MTKKTNHQISKGKKVYKNYSDGGDIVDSDPVMARAIYEKRLRTSMYQTTEAMQDSMWGLMEFYRVAGAGANARRVVTGVGTADTAGGEHAGRAADAADATTVITTK